MVSLLVATLLTADPIHGGAAFTLGVGVPFRSTNAGVQLGLKGFGEYEVRPKLGVGLVLPVSIGFYTQDTGLGSTATVIVVDLMPGARASYQVLDWIRAVAEFGVGPSIHNFKAVFFNVTTLEQSRTDFGMRGALSVELAPPSLDGLMFLVEPVLIQGRFAASNFPEYRFSVGVGYRR